MHVCCELYLLITYAYHLTIVSILSHKKARSLYKEDVNIKNLKLYTKLKLKDMTRYNTSSICISISVAKVVNNSYIIITRITLAYLLCNANYLLV